jgi:5S rRNA maturation endonuclease (ribonuclease M5)/KaiC/GvpD/RAD55 family RecA-like ATPase
MTTSPRGIDVVAAALSRRGPLRRVGTGLLARCPAHDDARPSLTVGVGADGRVLVHCHAGCDTRQVMAALDLPLITLAPPQIAERSEPARRIVETYPYTDAEGNLLYEVVRFVPKGFAQRRREGAKWIWNLHGVARVLYRLPAVLDAIAAGASVWVTEGEKDAEAIVRAGECATTPPGGASAPWLPTYTEALTGANEVIVVADADEPGRRHARAVLEALRPVVGRVIAVEPREGKDAADHLARGFGLDDFAVIEDEWAGALEAPTEGEAAVPSSTKGPERVRDLAVDWARLFADEDDSDWLVEPLLPRERQVALFAPAKTGKSLLALAAALAVATGQDAFGTGRAAEPMPVLYIDLEMSASDVRERLEDMGHGPSSDLSHLVYILGAAVPPLDTPEGGAWLAQAIEEVHPALVVLDTMAGAVGGAEDSADTYRAFALFSGRVLRNAGVSVLRLDHAGKDVSREQRGSSAKAADVDAVIRLGASSSTQVVLETTRSRVPWMPHRTSLVVEADPLRYTLAANVWPAGTTEVALLLDSLDVPLDARRRDAVAALRRSGQRARQAVVDAALRWRRMRG